MTNRIQIESDAIIVLIGAMGTGKSTFAKMHFEPHDIISTDHIRKELTGDFENQEISGAAFRILYSMLEVRGEYGLLTVVDSTGSRSLLERARKISEENARPLYAFIFPHLDKEEITQERMAHRMRYLHAYYRQVERINKTDLPKRYTPIVLPKRGRASLQIEFKDSGDAKYHLPVGYNYVVVPDLHGEWRALDDLDQQIGDKEDYKIIQLGDLVDRGESSFETFKLAHGLYEAGFLYSIKSNHDDKLARYFRKWIKDPNRRYEDINPYDEQDAIPAYGMKIAHGLGKTLQEFYGLDCDTMDWYANKFVDYYSDLPEYLTLKTSSRVHYFVHAGITQKMMMGKEPTKTDMSHAIYRTIGDPKEIADMAQNIEPGKEIWVHVGHEYRYDEYLVENSDRFFLVKHDVGFGKHRVFDMKEIPDFMTIPK